MLDDDVEKHLIEKLKAWMGNRTLIIATHRPAVMQLVERILLIENGQITRDGRKEEILVSPPKVRANPHEGKVNVRTQGASS